LTGIDPGRPFVRAAQRLKRHRLIELSTAFSRQKGEASVMKSKIFPAITAALLMLLVAGYGSSLASSGSSASPAATACSGISEGGEGAVAACEQGYKGSRLKASLVKTCLRGVGEVAVVENQLDCKMGYIAVPGTTKAAPSASSKAKAECASITEGGSPTACEQGYADAVAGLKQYESCDHLGAGAITTFESVGECEDGWFAGKVRTTCIPGSDVQNGQPGTTINADPEADKTCAAA
jgi:hypothetical protein